MVYPHIVSSKASWYNPKHYYDKYFSNPQGDEIKLPPQLSALALYLKPYKENLCEIKSSIKVQITTDEIIHVINSLRFVPHCINNGQEGATFIFEGVYEVRNYYGPIEYLWMWGSTSNYIWRTMDGQAGRQAGTWV